MQSLTVKTIGLLLGCTTTIALADSITDTFATGDTLTATQMNNIKSAVNDNDSRITTLESATPDSTPDTIADDGVIDDSEASDNLSIDNGLLSAPSGGSVVNVQGHITGLATYVVDGVTGTFVTSNEKFIMEAGPNSVGVAQPIDHTIFTRLCQDLDGCEITVGMMDWDAGQPGQIASIKFRFFYSETDHPSGTWWRLENPTASFGKDGDNSLSVAIASFDCLLSDGEVALSTPNARQDLAPGFSLLNVQGGGYSDTTVVCRLIIED